MYEVDLHLHTYYSDGVYSPEEVVEMAHWQGVKKLSITDHDEIKKRLFFLISKWICLVHFQVLLRQKILFIRVSITPLHT